MTRSRSVARHGIRGLLGLHVLWAWGQPEGAGDPNECFQFHKCGLGCLCLFYFLRVSQTAQTLVQLRWGTLDSNVGKARGRYWTRRPRRYWIRKAKGEVLDKEGQAGDRSKKGVRGRRVRHTISPKPTSCGEHTSPSGVSCRHRLAPER